MITQVSYARLYNTGNYENIRLEATATVEAGDTAAAFAEAQSAVHAAYEQWQADREAEAKRQQEEWEAKRQEQRAAIRARNDEPPF